MIQGKTSISISIMLLIALSGCTSESKQPKADSPRLITVLPVIGLIVEPLLSDIELNVLLDGGQSPHGYQIKPSEALFINSADIMITAHANIDGWATELFSGPTYSLWNTPTADPHFWTDPVSVQSALRRLSVELCNSYPEKCISIRRRANSFSARIESVSVSIRQKLMTQDSTCFVTAQPFMNHFLARFNIPQIGPVQSQPGHDPSPASLAKLYDQVNEQKCSALLVQKSVDNRAFHVLARDLGIPVLEIDPLGSEASTYEEFLTDLSEVLEILSK